MSYIPVTAPHTVVTPVHARVLNSGYAFDRDVAYGRAYGSADGDWIEWCIFCDAGTYSLEIQHYTWSDAGIMTIYLDGTNVGSVDTYAAGGQTPNQSAVVTDIAIDEAGRHHLKFETTGKNASSAGYYVLLCGEWSLWRTD